MSAYPSFSELPRMVILISQHETLPMDFADASLIILAEPLGYGRIVATDRRDFHAYRWKNHHPFHKANRIRPGWTRRQGMFGCGHPARVPARRWLDITGLIGRWRFRQFTGDARTE